MRMPGESETQSGNDFLTEWTLSVERNVEQAESNGTCERREIDASAHVSHVVHLTSDLFVVPSYRYFPI